jgi:hypothetical protein
LRSRRAATLERSIEPSAATIEKLYHATGAPMMKMIARLTLSARSVTMMHGMRIPRKKLKESYASTRQTAAPRQGRAR